MAGEEGKKKKGSCIVWAIILIAFVVGVLKYGEHMKKQKTTGVAAEMQTPEGTVKAYIRFVNKVQQLNPEDVGINDLLSTVTKDDKKWYFANQERIFEARRGGFNKFIGYSPTSPLEESIGSMMEILDSSPNRDDSLIESAQIDGKIATVKLKQGTAYGTFRNYTVELKKEGSLWKVSGFCGARKQLEREIGGM